MKTGFKGVGTHCVEWSVGGAIFQPSSSVFPVIQFSIVFCINSITDTKLNNVMIKQHFCAPYFSLFTWNSGLTSKNLVLLREDKKFWEEPTKHSSFKMVPFLILQLSYEKLQVNDYITRWSIFVYNVRQFQLSQCQICLKEPQSFIASTCLYIPTEVK